MREQKKRLYESKEPKEQQLVSLNQQLQVFTAQKTSWEKDLGTALLSQLSADEQSELENLQGQIDNLKVDLNEIMRERSAVSFLFYKYFNFILLFFFSSNAKRIRWITNCIRIC